MVDYYFIGMIYEGIVLLIALSLLIKTISNYIKVRHKLSLLLFLVILCYVCAIFFSWLSKVMNVYLNIDYIINNDVPDPNTPLSWILLRVTDFRISYAFLTVGIAISFLFKIKVFEEEFNKIKKYMLTGFTIFNLILSIFVFQKGNELFDVLVFFFVFIFMFLVYIPFLLRAVKAHKSTDHLGFRKSFLYLSIMSLSYISILLCLLVDRVYILMGSFGFTIFYFLSWIFAIIGIFSTYYGYLKLDMK